MKTITKNNGTPMEPLFFNQGIPVSLLFICGALLIPLLSGRLKSAYMVLLPVIALVTLFKLSDGDYWTYSFLDYQLTLGRIDGLSRVFGYIFALISIIAVIYALRVKVQILYLACDIAAVRRPGVLGLGSRQCLSAGGYLAQGILLETGSIAHGGQEHRGYQYGGFLHGTLLKSFLIFYYIWACPARCP